MANTVTPLRYPGGKSTLANFVKSLISQNALWDCEYVEPFCGGAGIAMELLRTEFASSVRINDVDPAIHCFWMAVINDTDELCARISKVRISIPVWRRQRAILQNPSDHSIVDVGFAAFFLNRANRSGILTAGPIGGLEQTGAWLMDARFNRTRLITTIVEIAAFRNRIRVHSEDAAQFLRTSDAWATRQSLVYLDPPYVVQGKRLYRNSYTEEDHTLIAETVETLSCPWLVSYDNVPLIRKLYKKHRSLTYGIGYSANERTTGREIMIFSSDLLVPKVKSPVGLHSDAWKSFRASA